MRLACKPLLCIGGPLHGEAVAVASDDKWFAKAVIPSTKWPANQPDDLRIDVYIRGNDRWVWDPEGHANGGY